MKLHLKLSFSASFNADHITELLAEKDKLEMSNNAQLWKVEQQGVCLIYYYERYRLYL